MERDNSQRFRSLSPFLPFPFLLDRATECAGAVALAVGKEQFAPYLADFMKLSMDGSILTTRFLFVTFCVFGF